MSRIKIGWASQDVSAKTPVNIPGQFHMRISQGVLDPVTATALVLENGGDAVCFVSLDSVVVTQALVNDVRELAAKKVPELAPEKIVLNATHAHTGPGQNNAQLTFAETTDAGPIPTTMKIADGNEYRKKLARTIVDMVKTAWEGRAPGGIAYGYGYAVVGHSRRVLYFDDLSKRPGQIINSTHGVNGHAAMYGNTNDPKFDGYEAGADHFINLLYTFDAKGKLTGAVVNVPCPSQNSEQLFQLSASFWHETRQRIRKKHGDIFILPQCAAGGDLAPRILHYKQAQARRFRLKYGENEPFEEAFARADIAERISAAFDEVYSWAKKEISRDAVVKHEVRTVNLAKRLITEAEYQDAVAGLAKLAREKYVPEKGDKVAALKANSQLVSGRSRYAQIIRRYKEQKKQPKLPVEVHAVRVGDIAFATNRFELYMDFMHRIQARSPFIQTFIVQLCGVPEVGQGTYLATKRGAKNRGYSASRFCNLVSPQGGQQIVEASLKLLNKLAK